MSSMRYPDFRAAWMRIPVLDRDAMARDLGTTQAHLSNIAFGCGRSVNPLLAVAIERRLGVSRRHLRPTDWGDIWPELIDADHPWPPLPQEQAA